MGMVPQEGFAWLWVPVPVPRTPRARARGTVSGLARREASVPRGGRSPGRRAQVRAPPWAAPRGFPRVSLHGFGGCVFCSGVASVFLCGTGSAVASAPGPPPLGAAVQPVVSLRLHVLG